MVIIVKGKSILFKELKESRRTSTTLGTEIIGRSVRRNGVAALCELDLFAGRVTRAKEWKKRNR